MMASEAPISRVTARAYTIPTDAPESDGTIAWDSTTLVVVGIEAAGKRALGYTYADIATAALIRDKLAPLLLGADALAHAARYVDLTRAVRNLGRTGVCAMGISAVDAALWDLKGRLLGAPLSVLLGAARASIPAYGSGGFTSYTIEALQRQLAGWAQDGFRRVKMKVGREPENDQMRMAKAREAIGREIVLFVDANGAYAQEQALYFIEQSATHGVEWFEEPVSSDDLAGLRFLRERRPGKMAIAAGEYGYYPLYFRHMLEAQAVDVLQADATRCGGVTGFMDAAAIADAFGVPLSSHCAPALHVSLCCSARRAIHVEYFHDHARIERMLFDGAPVPHRGELAPALDRPGLGLEFKQKDAECYAR
jgi:L-alanine-DL-glutamate epimerase-like enolase superfamily enzyme